MTALRHLRKIRRRRCKLACQGCESDIEHSEAFCSSCAANSDDIGVDIDGGGLGIDASRDLARVFLDMRHGRQRDAMNRLERVLDAEAPHWRELA